MNTATTNTNDGAKVMTNNDIHPRLKMTDAEYDLWWDSLTAAEQEAVWIGRRAYAAKVRAAERAREEAAYPGLIDPFEYILGTFGALDKE